MTAVDFDNMVLKPLIEQCFGIPVTWLPIKSQPGGMPFTALGSWHADPYTIIMEDNAPMATSIFKIGIRLRDFAVPPVKGDQMTISGDTYTLDSPEYDGQGGVMWTVKAAASNQETQYVPT